MDGSELRSAEDHGSTHPLDRRAGSTHRSARSTSGYVHRDTSVGCVRPDTVGCYGLHGWCSGPGSEESVVRSSQSAP